MIPTTARCGIVTGLAAETRIAAVLGRALPGGGSTAGAEAVAESLVGEGAVALLSLGLAGGIDPRARPGEVLVPRVVLEGAARFAVDARLADRLGEGAPSPLLAVDTIVADAGAKARLHAATGAWAVDMESAAVARVAARHGLPFAVLRVVCDPASRTLPPAALLALDAGGGVALSRVLASLARTPGQFPALLALARDAAVARRALVRRVRQIRVRGGLMA